MSLTLQDIRTAYNDARETINQSDAAVRMAVSLIRGRLRTAKVDPYDLKDLKRELQDFDATTKRWKAKK